MIMPPCWDSSTQSVESCSRRVRFSSASRSSWPAMSVPRPTSRQPWVEESVAVTSRTSKSRATRARLTDAATLTALSIEDAVP